MLKDEKEAVDPGAKDPRFAMIPLESRDESPKKHNTPLDPDDGVRYLEREYKVAHRAPAIANPINVHLQQTVREEEPLAGKDALNEDADEV